MAGWDLGRLDGDSNGQGRVRIVATVDFQGQAATSKEQLTMTIYPYPLQAKILFLLGVSLVVISCKCELKNMNVSARVVRTQITAPPGGGSHRFLEVKASGLHPNVDAKLSIPNYPTPTGSIDLEESVKTDSQGSFSWTKEPITFLGSNAEPNTDVTVKVKENNSDCVTVTLIKQSEFMK
jgi:hypothetical protein